MNMEHVAWLRFYKGTLKLSDSDSPGAFKVYRKGAALDWMEKMIDEILPNGEWRDEILKRIEEERHDRT